MSKNTLLKYKVTTEAHRGMKREFTNKREAVAYARLHRKDGWAATVTDMRTGKPVLFLNAA